MEEWDFEELLFGMLFGSWEGIVGMEFVKKAAEVIYRKAMGKPGFPRTTSAVPVMDNLATAVQTLMRLAGDDDLTPADMATGIQSLGDVLMVGGVAYTPAGVIGAVTSAIGMRSKQIIRWFEDR